MWPGVGVLAVLAVLAAFDGLQGFLGAFLIHEPAEGVPSSNGR
jgi:hypothetical protein